MHLGIHSFVPAAQELLAVRACSPYLSLLRQGSIMYHIIGGHVSWFMTHHAYLRLVSVIRQSVYQQPNINKEQSNLI